MNLLSHNFILYSEQLAKLQQADNRTDIADFLCLQIWNGGRYKNPFFLILKNIGAVSSGLIVPVDLSCCRFASTAPFLLIANKTTRPMNNSVDLNAYLVEVYLHTEQLQNPHTTEFDFDRFLKAFELWWKRCEENAFVPTVATAHLVLGMVNLSVLLLEQHLDGLDLFQQRNRLNRIKSGLVQRMAKHLPECEQSPAA